jgi:hypothetical protein
VVAVGGLVPADLYVVGAEVAVGAGLAGLVANLPE